MSFEKILIVEDELVVRNLLQSIFQRHKLPVNCAGNLAEASALLAREQFDLMLLDIRLPDGDGQKFLEQVVAMPEHPLVVMVTGYGTIESAVGCMRAGAFDYVLKPFSPSQIDVILKKAQSYRQLLRVNRLLSDDPDDEDGVFVGRSPAIVRLRQLVERVAPTDATVLVTGESGTGKEMIAREFYRRSPRRNQTFIKVNCAAVSENLIESEFFGHERGAFTGATERREGRFELAHQGTLLLDEVSEIPRTCRRSCCACCRSASSSAWAAAARSRSTCASSRPRIAICSATSRRANSARTSITGSMFSPCTCRRCASTWRMCCRSPTTFSAVSPASMA